MFRVAGELRAIPASQAILLWRIRFGMLTASHGELNAEKNLFKTCFLLKGVHIPANEQFSQTESDMPSTAVVVFDANRGTESSTSNGLSPLILWIA